MAFLELVSKLFGVLYVSAWSISFYPPLLLNYQLKSTEGISIDFIALNIVGYIALVSSMSLLLFNSEVRRLYYEKNSYYPLLTNIDLIYSVHGILLTLVTISQLFFWGFKKRSLAIKKITKLIILTVFIVIFTLLYSVQIHSNENTSNFITILDIAIILSYIKIIMSLIKYIPQLLHNYKRRSVVGFSIFTIFLDLTGGILSILQLFIDAYIMTGTLNFEILINNGGKLGLSFITLFFDSCFIYQWLIFEKNQPHHHVKILEDEVESIHSDYRSIRMDSEP